MPKYQVEISVTKTEIWHVEAENEHEAEEFVFEHGKLIECEESGHEYIETKELPCPQSS